MRQNIYFCYQTTQSMMIAKPILPKSILLWVALILPLPVVAQSDIKDLFKSGPADATKLITAYTSPLFKGLGVGLNSAWTNTARAKKPLRFDLRVSATAAFVPASDRSFDVNELGLSTIRPVNKSESIGPTAFGSAQKGAEMEIYANGFSGGNFRLPEGSGINFVPSPQVQLTVGLLKHMDVSLRLVPKIKLGEKAGNLNLFGIGAKLEVLPMLLGDKHRAIPFDFAVAFGYTKSTYDIPMDANGQPATNQTLEIEIDGFSAEALISKKITVFTPFASIGFNNSKSHLRALGTYEFHSPTAADPNNKDTHIDPIKITQTGVEGIKATLGFQLQLSFFQIFGSYTQSKYSYANAGIGFAIGK